MRTRLIPILAFALIPHTLLAQQLFNNLGQAQGWHSPFSVGPRYGGVGHPDDTAPYVYVGDEGQWGSTYQWWRSSGRSQYGTLAGSAEGFATDGSNPANPAPSNSSSVGSYSTTAFRDYIHITADGFLTASMVLSVQGMSMNGEPAVTCNETVQSNGGCTYAGSTMWLNGIGSHIDFNHLGQHGTGGPVTIAVLAGQTYEFVGQLAIIAGNCEGLWGLCGISPVGGVYANAFASSSYYLAASGGASFTTSSGADYRLQQQGDPGVAPEPASIALLATGLTVLGGIAARRRRA